METITQFFTLCPVGKFLIVAIGSFVLVGIFVAFEAILETIKAKFNKKFKESSWLKYILIAITIINIGYFFDCYIDYKFDVSIKKQVGAIFRKIANSE